MVIGVRPLPIYPKEKESPAATAIAVEPVKLPVIVKLAAPVFFKKISVAPSGVVNAPLMVVVRTLAELSGIIVVLNVI